MAMVAPSGNTVYTYHFNPVGSTVAMTDLARAIVNKYAYSPFGGIISQSEAIPQPFKFVGQFGVMAEPNGLYYMRARYYDPSLGRFISEDPLSFGGGDVNLMAYVGNNPVNAVDPWGLCANKNNSGSISISGGGTLGIIDVSGDSDSTVVSLTSPQIGAGINITYYNPQNVSSSEPPLTISIGSEHLGISFTNDFSHISVNIGFAFGPSPVNISVPIYNIQWR